MRMMKRMIRSIMIACCMVLLCAIPCYAVPITIIDDLFKDKWEYTVSKGESTLTKYSGISKVITIPSSIDGYPVTKIGHNLFDGATITSVSIPESIEYIDTRAFADCKYLTSIYYNAKDAYASKFRSDMSTHVFVNAGKFSKTLKVTFGPAVVKVPSSLFEADEGEYAHVTDVIFSNNVQIIDSWAFGNCMDLKNVAFGSGLLRLETHVFENCLGLTSITIPQKVENIGDACFAGCKYLKQINYNAVDCKVGYFRSVPDTYVFRNAGKFSPSLNVVIGNGVKKIPTCFFETPASEYAHVTNVTIPSSVNKIGDWVFNNCFDLKTVTIASRNCEFPRDAFENCPSSLVFKVYRGSTAETFAKEHGFRVSYIDQAIQISNCSIRMEKNSYMYRGIRIMPGVDVRYGNTRLTKNVDYDVMYGKNTNVGSASIVIKGKGKYTGSVEKKFSIVPAGTQLTKVSGKSKSIKISVKKQKKQTTGYEIQYADTGNFVNAVTKTMKNSKTSITCKKLKPKRKYYVRVRTYKTVGGKKYYSGWSKVKSVKTKK